MEPVLIAYIMANLADIVSTNKVLRRGGRELNPVMRWAMEKFGKFWVVPKLALAGFAAAMILLYGDMWMLWAATALYAFVALLNLRTASKM